MYALLPNRPIIFVPTDFGGSIMRWPAIARELAHIVWRTLPGLREEVTRLVGPSRSHTAIKGDGRRFRVDHRAVLSAWIDALFCDFFAALCLGPAAMRGMVHSLACPEDPLEIQTSTLSPYEQGLDRTPPAALRVALVAETLLQMGYIKEVRALEALWRELHGEIDALFLPIEDNRLLKVPFADFLAVGRTLIQSLYRLPHSGLADTPWTAVHGLEMTPGVWNRVQTRAQDLVADQIFDDDGRVVVAAGIEAADLKEGLDARISRGVRRAILGRGESAVRVADRHYEPPTVGLSDSLTKSEVVESVVLQALLHRKHARSVPRRSHDTSRSLAV